MSLVKDNISDSKLSFAVIKLILSVIVLIYSLSIMIYAIKTRKEVHQMCVESGACLK